MRTPGLALSALVIAGAASVAAGCGGASGAATGAASTTGKIEVTAAENFWGSIAAQLGGSKVAVTSIIVNPDTDPHSYEPTAADGVAIARSQMAIVNGIGYDTWASKLLAANPSSGRAVLDVGHLLGDLEIGDHAVAQRPARGDRRRRAADHPLGVGPHGVHLAGQRVRRHDRGLRDDDPLPLDVDERVRGAEVDRHVVDAEGRREMAAGVVSTRAVSTEADARRVPNAGVS